MAVADKLHDEYHDSMKAIGQFLQLTGLVVLPIAMFTELSGILGQKGLRVMVTMLVFGIAAFCVGRIVEGYGRN
ncbi:MAG: hypothetical protein QGF59_03305 [Pirellulaceae bacterium]|jgi:hypothetical protein|nr:hypothetical protein [Planctomycetaceae bacterium]MDP6717650.1 hypothetical protein [Pirellulaceae bacterium]